jgi:hypothetical protein
MNVLTNNLDLEKISIFDLIGDEVCVAVSIEGIIRNGFMTQMSIQGTLEENENQFRIVKDERTYTYFSPNDVLLLNLTTTEVPTIHVKINQEDDELPMERNREA